MSNFVRLKSDIWIPRAHLLKHAGEIYQAFGNVTAKAPELLMHLSIAARHNFEPTIVERHLTEWDIEILEGKYHDYHIGPLKEICSYPPMAKTALAASMIVAHEFNGEVEGYLTEPLQNEPPLLPYFYDIYGKKEDKKVSYITALPTLPNA